MTTTLVKDSMVGDAWIQNTMASVPLHRIMDAATGQPTGDMLTGPVRLAFEHLWEPTQPGSDGKGGGKYDATLLFPPNVDFRVLYEEYYKACGQFFPEYYVAQSQQYMGLHSPFRDQAEKLKFAGFTPGCVFVKASTQYKPPIVDSRRNPIVDRNKVYSGVWAICAINTYPYGKNPPQPKKGISFGLQSVMIIGDDTKFGGQGPDPKELYAGVNVTAPVVRPDMVAGMPTGAPPPAAGIPGYTTPGGGVNPPMPGYSPQPPVYGTGPAMAAVETEDQRMMREMGIPG